MGEYAMKNLGPKTGTYEPPSVVEYEKPLKIKVPMFNAKDNPDAPCCRKHWEEANNTRAGAMDLGNGHFALINPVGMPFIVCKVCGNKRCPKATDCSLVCTNSNESGQEGSIYG